MYSVHVNYVSMLRLVDVVSRLVHVVLMRTFNKF